MSDLLIRLADFLESHRHHSDIHIVAHSSEPFDLPSETDESEKVTASRVLEGDGALEGISVPAPEGRSGFTHFLDGVQQSQVVFFWGPVPVVYAHTAAVIRERRADGTLDTWDAVDSEALYLTFGHLPQGALSRLQSMGLPLQDVKLPADDPPSMVLMYRRTRNAIGHQRARLEQDLAQRWQQACPPASGAWLMVDGNVQDPSIQVRSHMRLPAHNVVGVVKNCRSAYFTLEQQARIYRLREGERSPVFQAASARGVCSFYERLFNSSGLDLLFGLVRLELAQPDRLDHVAPLASSVAGWMLLERAPLSCPDSRWHQMVYPIFDCEQYLKATGPSATVRRAALLGV